MQKLALESRAAAFCSRSPGLTRPSRQYSPAAMQQTPTLMPSKKSSNSAPRPNENSQVPPKTKTKPPANSPAESFGPRGFFRRA